MIPRTNTLKVAALAIAAAALTLLFCASVDLSDGILGTGVMALGMAVTANQVIKRDAGDRSSGGVLAAKTLYEGTLAFVDASTGYITDDDNAGANKFAGIVLEEADNSGGSSGDINVELLTRGTFILTGSGFSQADVGKTIYASDNYTITTTSTSNAAIGVCRRFVSATQLAVSIDSTL